MYTHGDFVSYKVARLIQGCCKVNVRLRWYDNFNKQRRLLLFMNNLIIETKISLSNMVLKRAFLI